MNELTGQHELIHLQTPCGLPYVLPLNITHLGSRKATEQNRQNKECQESCGDKATNNHAGQWLLDFRTHARRQQHRYQTKRRGYCCHQDRTQTGDGTFKHRGIHVQPILYSLIDAFDHNDPVEHRHTK